MSRGAARSIPRRRITAKLERSTTEKAWSPYAAPISQATSRSDHLLLNPEKTRIVDFAHGFRFLGALFQDNAIWVPWKNDRVKGRILFMAPPLPLGMRTRFESAPPRSAMELALDRAGPGAWAAFADHTPRAEGPERKVTPVAFLYLTEQGTILRKAGDRFLVEKEDEVLLDLPYHKLENVLLFGNIQVTTQALAELLEKGVNMSLFSRQGQYRGSLAPPRGKNIELRLAQFDCYRDPARTLALARAVVAAKIANGLTVLARYRSHNEAPAAYNERRAEMGRAASSLVSANTAVELDGYEGAAARGYFEALMQFNKSGMAWPGRQKHPATDPLNALLSLGYTLPMHELTALLEGAGLDPYLGFLHQLDYGRPSLALDLMEAFRHPVVDPLTLTLVNRAVLGAEDFHSGGERPGVFLAPGRCGGISGNTSGGCWSGRRRRRNGRRGFGGGALFSGPAEGRGGTVGGGAAGLEAVRTVPVRWGGGDGMQYVVCYDIADDRRRDRMARALLDYGPRAQESVFVSNLDSELAARMMERVNKLADVTLRPGAYLRVMCGVQREDAGGGDGGNRGRPGFYII